VNDDELMQRIAGGDEAAFQLLVTRWEQAVFAFLCHMVGSRADAEDLCQETFLRVFAQASRYRPVGKFRSWLLRIAGNLARSWLRRRKLLRWIRFDVSRHDRATPAPAPDRGLEVDQLQTAVREALAQLPERQREAVILRRYQELSYQEIAAVLGTTPGAVESLLQRAAATLRKHLAGKVDLT
jgi:RNA polymerase sigma-70 factor (ECF subfamily)